MRTKSLMVALLGIFVATPVMAAPDWQKVDEAIGRSGAPQSDGVHRYSFPRSDLRVTLDNAAIKPALALGSWAAFQPMGDQVMIMGDLVLTHEEVAPVMRRLLAGGFTITALHNHLLRSSPATMYMHIGAHGDPVKLAQSLHDGLALSGTPLAPPSPQTGLTTEPLAFDAAALDGLMRAKGKPNGGVYQFSFPRREAPTAAGMSAPATMGTATAINFQPTGGGNAAVTGDFVLIASEVDPVMRALAASGIEITALHNHMLDDQPRLFFMHFWSNQDAQLLARGLRAALDKMQLERH